LAEREKKRKVRIDALLTERGLAESRSKARALIMAAKVLVDGAVVDKAGREVSSGSVITLKESMPYVGRGGVKLAGALDGFRMDVTGLVALDVGSSTGGFTDCLLQRGAERVHAVDVGRGLLDFRLRGDPRVHLLEGRNIRHIEDEEIGEKIDLAVVDVSFISLTKVLPKVRGLVKEGGRVLALVKPQFEVGKGEVGKGGIVKDAEKHRRVVGRIKGFAEGLGFKPVAEAESPIKGAKGNREFWVLLVA
jgi:23S rRNA (cytidine1920-2'-O)/16S rRNA (cytidine1409-2'-O)-methyltransferase